MNLTKEPREVDATLTIAVIDPLIHETALPSKLTTPYNVSPLSFAVSWVITLIDYTFDYQKP